MDKPEMREEVLSLLEQNARMPNAEIADRLAVPEQAIADVITEMEADGTIIGYYALVNEQSLDESAVRAIIEVEVQPQRDGGFDPIAQRVSKFSEVRTVHLVSGRYDLRLEVVGSSLHEVASFVASKLAPLEGVKSTVTHFLLKKYKEAGFRLQEDESYERLKITP
ncbi:MAG: Lrp/AsnC family transcriptional regulator [Lentisphaerae bacterium]|jgi:DNA-binding Lrp family transcriptional regulator|nr:Lrp/AsnC family transcriptional regulator [Lentisphaerota bacterium]MBT4816891.1 Lrp/AsnC family transcriptional regulator [Lentisphaerota bacterium]MBT5606836.1 Lrp/AsnC family transcriptional regulator [Lentisphaerota bacterium]MBT7055306.1 Lrp/AsnC family transcriptional regulator [Lentisphaerota bacterium]MBT7843087.1 Lrp/AsnC family transcriptional regulator [Lentisphaerota bacterium]